LAQRTRLFAPPWSLSESAFITLCERSDDCRKACPENILFAGRGGFPEVDFKRGACTFCEKCLEACPTGALKGSDEAKPPWGIKAGITPECLSIKGIVCRTCGEACEAEAITFKLKFGGTAKPKIDDGLCTGCGECLHRCPVDAVVLFVPTKEDAAP
jgi:ferredoxin-type protein NapF